MFFRSNNQEPRYKNQKSGKNQAVIVILGSWLVISVIFTPMKKSHAA